MSENQYTESLLKSIEENENGSFQLENSNGRAMLTISPPGKKGKMVELQDILSRIRLFGIEEFKSDEILKIIKTQDNQPHDIGIWKGGNPEPGTAEVEASEDLMSASITIFPPKHGGDDISLEGVLALLRQKGIVYGINEAAIGNLLAAHAYFKKTPVAQGMLPVTGSSGYIKYHFDIIGRPDLREDQTGRIDFKEIGIIKSVHKGDLLAEIHPPVPGQYGYNVKGEPIPPRESPEARWKLGENVRLSEDKTKIYAEITGRPVVDRNNVVKVDDICHLEKVDFSTGNVNFPGTIIVEGTIADDFHLETEGSIIIKKSIGRVFLKAGGDIILSGGVMGKNGGQIESARDIYVKFIEQGKITAKGNIYVGEACMHSEITADGSVFATDGRGEIIGGEIICGDSLVCNKLGAVVETHTYIMAGTPPEVIAELEKIREEIQERKTTLEKVKLSIHKLREDATRRELDNKEMEMLHQLNAIEEKYTRSLQSLIKQYETAVNSFEPKKNAFVGAEKTIFPGVEINFGKGKTWKSGLRELPGRNYFYLNKQDDITQAAGPPKPQNDTPV